VGLSVVHLAQNYDLTERFAIVWGDNYMTNTGVFLDMLSAADKIVASDKANIVFLGETPRFANNNLGWIGVDAELGKQDQRPYFAFSSWDYRPPIDRCQEMYASGNYVWNTGYFVTSLGFITESYQKFQPEMWALLSDIAGSINQSSYDELLAEVYPTIEVASFDDAIVKYIANDQAVVLHGDTGWSDPGTLYALKESINPDTQVNVERGLVRTNQTKDSLLYNYEAGKLMAAVGLEGMIVVNTEDALLVVHKDQIALVKELVNELVGTELDKFA
jgi:mannose-1-phosphate guanylyltransferase